jgi:hypothetical protein
MSVFELLKRLGSLLCRYVAVAVGFSFFCYVTATLNSKFALFCLCEKVQNKPY